MSIIILQHHELDPPARLGDTLRDHGHRCRILRSDQGDTLPDLDDVDGLVIMGGPMNVDDADSLPWLNDEITLIKQAHDAGLPVVGVCLGAQLIAAALGGKVEAMDAPEAGFANVKLAFPGTVDPVLAGQPWDSMQFHAHGQHITELPPGAVPLAGSKLCRTQAFVINRTTYAFQYHFEWTRDQIQTWLSAEADWLSKHGLDPAALQADVEPHYRRYRHQGDRLCQRLTDLVFSIDRRLDHKSGPVTSFDPAVS